MSYTLTSLHLQVLLPGSPTKHCLDPSRLRIPLFVLLLLWNHNIPVTLHQTSGYGHNATECDVIMCYTIPEYNSRIQWN